MIPVQFEDLVCIYYIQINEQVIANVPIRVFSVNYTHLCRLTRLATLVSSHSKIDFPNIAAAITYGLNNQLFIQGDGTPYTSRSPHAPALVGVEVPSSMILPTVNIDGKTAIYVYNQYRAVKDESTYQQVNCDLSSTGSIMM